MHLTFRNVNEAFRGLVKGFELRGGYAYGTEIKVEVVETSSRVGKVLQITEPVTITYWNPLERVLFNQARDANPFLHLMESLWMLAGRQDIAPMAYYAANYAKQVQDGDNPNANGAYGHRWRNHFGTPDSSLRRLQGADQLEIIIQELRDNPKSRRAVLQMWTVKDDLLKIRQVKDVCCNTNAYFLLREASREEIETHAHNGYLLDMTVCNRSNDLIWGMLGANVVHFSFLQEYLAANIGVGVGVYNQFTNNLHVYTERFTPELWLNDTTPDYYTQLPRLNSVRLIEDKERFEVELKHFNETYLGKDLGNYLFTMGEYKEPFFKSVAFPMAIAFHQHKKREYKSALSLASEILADDWRITVTNWLRVRQARYNKAKDDGPIKEEVQ